MEGKGIETAGVITELFGPFGKSRNAGHVTTRDRAQCRDNKSPG